MSERFNINQFTAVILAGGLGTRIKALYPDLPKPMIPVCGRPFIEWVLRYLRKQGVRRAIISSGYRAEVIAQHFASQPIPGMEVQCVAESSPQGTGGGFLCAATVAAKAPEAWMVLNGDSLVLADLKLAATPFQEPEVQAVVLGIEVPDTSRYGKLRFNCTGQLLHFAEKEPGRGIVNAGVYFFRHSLLAQFPAQRPLSFEKDVFPALLLKETVVQVSVAAAPFLDIGTPASLALAENFIQQNLNAFETV